MKKILGLDLGTNSIGWALIQKDPENNHGEIKGMGSRIIPMSQDVLGKFDSGVSISQTAVRTAYRATRRLYQRDNLRRERLHRVLNILGFLPKHYQDSIDFEKRLGQFKKGLEVKLNYLPKDKAKHEFIFMDSFNEMVSEFQEAGVSNQLPYDWTLYYLRKKALKAKVNKEELAWLILNFNQKRGYYQIRGEEGDETKDQKKEYVVLDVDKLIESSDNVKSGNDMLYEVHFTNGWIYDKLIAKRENWVGKSKEFIVSTNKKRSGEIKRTFKAVNSEEDWLAIKSKTEQNIARSKKTVGEYIYESLKNNPRQKVRGKLIKTIERKFYKEEFSTILKKQIEFHPELRDKDMYQACVKHLYGKNLAHQENIKNRGFEHLILEDIVFYQRPLKSKKSTIGGCQYEYRTFLKRNEATKESTWVKKPLKGIAKSHPKFQEFRIWQFLHNLRVYEKDRMVDGSIVLDYDITEELLKSADDWTDLFDFFNARKDIEQQQLLKYFSDKGLMPKQLKADSNYRWNYVEDKKYPCNETGAMLTSRLRRVEGVNPTELLTETVLMQLWHIIYSVTDKIEFEKALKTFAESHEIDVNSFCENFNGIPPFQPKYGSYSEKAIKKLLPLMRIGKYHDETVIAQKVKSRIANIMERLNDIYFNLKQIDSVTDDDIPKRLLKSFLGFEGKSALSGLNTYQACYAVYNRHAEVAEINRWRTPEDIERYLESFRQHSLKNPIVEQVVTETLRVVRDIWKVHGKSEPGFFSSIHLELGREMKNSAEKRKKMTLRSIENENTNYRIKALLSELKSDSSIYGDIRPHSPSHQEILKLYEEGVTQNPSVNYQDISELEINKIRKNTSPRKAEIVKYKLWLEQGYLSPYTGRVIPLSKLFTSDYEIEHIIPQSRYFDDSLGNKVICESEINALKNNQTAFEFIAKHGTEKVSLGEGKSVTVLSLKDYESNCNQYFKKNRFKLKNLLSEEIPEGFISRQLNDSRYISKLIKGLLSNLVRVENETEVTAKNLISVTGAITSKLKQDWGLNDKWNELIAPRFKRMNLLTNSNEYGYKDRQQINGNSAGREFFRIQVPEEISRGFNKKRIDHRHHALDALVIACTTRQHIQYLNALNSERENKRIRESLLIQNEHGHFTKNFLTPWVNFSSDAKLALETVIISFKQNKRIINKANNRTKQWRLDNGVWKKVAVKQTQGDNWAIRKALHKETVSGKIQLDAPRGKIATASRVAISEIKNEKHLAKITDAGIQLIFRNHLANYAAFGAKKFEEAFSPAGIDKLNENIVSLNNGNKHQPILKVRMFEIGVKFAVGRNGNKPSKYVEAAKGTNLFFSIYQNEVSGKRSFSTIPLNEVIEHQKQVAHLAKNERYQVPIDNTQGQFLFSISPNDLVYVPNEEEQENPGSVDLNNLSKSQVSRVYKMVSCTGRECHFLPALIASLVKSYDAKSGVGEFGSLNKSELSFENVRIKESCWKLEVDRLGRVINFKR